MTDQTHDDEMRIMRRETPPWYVPDVVSILQLFLAVAIVIMVGFILYYLTVGVIKLSPDQDRLLMILFGIILGCFKDVYGFTYGSSAGQKRQGEVITKSLADKDKIIAGNVVAAAALASAAAPSADAMKAAAIVAPAAAEAAAPPAAEVAAPPAVDAALRQAGIEPHPQVVVAWWSMLSPKEQGDLSIESIADPRVSTFVEASKIGRATAEDLDYLVSRGLLTQDTADRLSYSTT